MKPETRGTLPWRWPILRLRWVLLALVLMLANALWRTETVYLDLRASGIAIAWAKPLVWELTSAVMVWLLLPLVQMAVLNAPWGRCGWRRFLGLHAMGTLAYWALHVAGMWISRIWIYRLAGWEAYNYGQTLYRVAMEGLKDVVSFAIFALLFHLLEARRVRQERELAAARLEMELREARLQALSAQLDPHFLFNALNTLSSVMYEDLAKADHLIAALGQMLRDGLRSEGPTWSLQRELEHLEHYLDFVETRFGDRLQVGRLQEPNLGAISVPRFALQRLVENALKHNQDTPGQVLHVTVEARLEGNHAQLSVTDDGAGFQPGSTGGVGLDNLRRSLTLLHGDQASLDTDNAPEGGARVRLRLPVGGDHA